MEKDQADKVVELLSGIQKLMVLDLMERGFTQNQIALTLGVGQATISRMFPKGVFKKAGN